jgi:hypothetical protein
VLVAVARNHFLVIPASSRNFPALPNCPIAIRINLVPGIDGERTDEPDVP